MLVYTWADWALGGQLGTWWAVGGYTSNKMALLRPKNLPKKVGTWFKFPQLPIYTLYIGVVILGTWCPSFFYPVFLAKIMPIL